MFSIGTRIVRFISHGTKRFTSTNIDLVDQVQSHAVRQDNLKKELKSLKIAILGLPNAGKSTLINELVQSPICPASSKVHTTRMKATAIYTKGDTQLEFIDTPGLVTPSHIKKFKLESNFENDTKVALKNIDIVGIIQDMKVIKAREVISKRVLNMIKYTDKDTVFILILNKIDKIKKKKLLLEVVKNLTNKEDYPQFADIFMISALTGDGVDDLRNYFLDMAKPSQWNYEECVNTDQKVEELIQKTVKAKAMNHLHDELPYQLKVTTEFLDYLDDGSIKATVLIKPHSERIVKFVTGAGGSKVKAIARESEQDLCNIFQTRVMLRITVGSHI